jgi:polyisoprenoid-binding protein YceI
MSTTTQTEVLPAGTWTVDPVHSDVAFGVDYMAGTFKGSFSKFDAQVSEGELRGSAEVASVDVKDPNLEAHLQSPDFFDAERHPQLTFEAKEIDRDGDTLRVQGEVTIKGHTEPADITGQITEPAADPFGNTRFGIKLTTTVDRTKFGVSWNNPLPSGGFALSNEVTILADLQFIQAQA